MFDKFDYFNRGYIFGVKTDKYYPYINYTWSQTLIVGGNQQIKDSGTAGHNLQQFFGQGCWFNGVDQYISIPAPTTGTRLTNSSDFSYILNIDSLYGTRGKVFMPYFNNIAVERNAAGMLSVLLDDSIGRKEVAIVTATTSSIKQHLVVTRLSDYLYIYVNGVLFNTISILNPIVGLRTTYIGGTSPYSQYSKGTIKDVYIFSRTLTQSEITQSYEQPELFYAMAQADDTCVLNMPMCETSSTVRDYKTGIDYPITNYTSSVRDNARRLPYGLQTSGFKRDSNGLILSKSNFLEADGVGYGDTGWIPDISKPTTIECILDKKSINDFQLNGTEYLRIGVASGNALYFRCGDKQPSVLNTAVDSVYYVVVALDGSIVTLYVNGIRNQTTSYVATLDTVSFKLFTSQWNKPSKCPIRLFKIHTKALTQEEITKNFNKYQSQGLLNE